MAKQNKKEQEIKSYQMINKETGEITPRFKYLVGTPRQYRFNGQTGRFNQDGIDDKGTVFEIIPIAWRIFTASNLFGRDKIENWAEIFFIDKENCVSSIMFNNTSASIFNALLAQIMYADLTLLEVKLTITSDRRTNEKVKSSYYVAQFNFEKAPKEIVECYAEYTKDYPIFRTDTISDSELITLSSISYRPHKISQFFIEENVEQKN